MDWGLKGGSLALERGGTSRESEGGQAVICQEEVSLVRAEELGDLEIPAKPKTFYRTEQARLGGPLGGKGAGGWKAMPDTS